MQNARRIELEDSASGGFSLVLHHEDGGLDQLMLTREEGAELHQWLGERQSGAPAQRPWGVGDLEGMIASLHDRASNVTEAEDPVGTIRGAMFRAAGHMGLAYSDLVMMPLHKQLASKSGKPK